MRSQRQRPGYRPCDLPEGLPELERSAVPPDDAACTLIDADEETLIWSQPTENGGRAVLKMYRHRGPVSWWREKHFRYRVQREYDALLLLAGHGIPCSLPLFWSCGTCADFGRYEILATREIPDAVPLEKLLASRDDPAGEADLRPLYAIVRRMHRSGFHRGALYTRNILVTRHDSPEPDFHVIDTPKAMGFPYDLMHTRMARIDLLDLTLGIAERKGMSYCASLAGAYGLDRHSALAFIDFLPRYRPWKLTRNLHRAECETRELLARAHLWWRRRTPTGHAQNRADADLLEFGKPRFSTRSR